MTNPIVKSVLVLDQNTGSRIHAKYFAGELIKSPEKQLGFEKKLFAKSSGGSSETEVLLMERNLAVFQSGQDVIFYVIGGENENELILASVLEAIVETLRSVLRGHLEKNTILDNLELLLLTVDEVVDAGSILETDTTVLSRRVMLRNESGGVVATAGVNVPQNANQAGGGLAELTLAGALNAAREQLVRLSRA